MSEANQTLDLDDFENILVSTVVLVNPVTGAPTASSIDVLGPEAPQRKALDFQRIRLARQQYQKSGGQVALQDPTEEYDDETSYLVTVTAGWNLTRAGQPLPYSTEAARNLYTDPKRQWVRNQVKRAIAEAERFIKGSVIA